MNADNQEPLYKRPFSAFDNKTPDQKIQELADRDEIRELISRYAHSVAHGITVADLFTDDGLFIVRTPGQPVQTHRGRAELVKEYSKLRPGGENPLPMIHNYLISISGDEAEGMCSAEIRASGNGQSLIGSGYYVDRFRRVNGRWKFAGRDATMIHMVPLQQGWATPPK